jgi:hypothetical protein
VHKAICSSQLLRDRKLVRQITGLNATLVLPLVLLERACRARSVKLSSDLTFDANSPPTSPSSCNIATHQHATSITVLGFHLRADAVNNQDKVG